MRDRLAADHSGPSTPQRESHAHVLVTERHVYTDRATHRLTVAALCRQCLTPGQGGFLEWAHFNIEVTWVLPQRSACHASPLGRCRCVCGGRAGKKQCPWEVYLSSSSPLGDSLSSSEHSFKGPQAFSCQHIVLLVVLQHIFTVKVQPPVCVLCLGCFAVCSADISLGKCVGLLSAVF